MQTYTTQSVPVARRLRFWSELASDRIAPMHVESGDRSAGFEARMTSYGLGPIVVTRAWSSAAIIHRAGQVSTRFQPRHFVVSMPAENGYRVRTAEWDRYVAVNNMLITDSTQTGMVTHSGCTVITLRIAEQLFRRYLPAGDNLAGTILLGDRGPGAMAAAMMRTLLPNRPHLFQAGSGDHLSIALLHAIAAACAETVGVAAASSTTAVERRCEIIRYVEANLGDPELNVTAVAAQFDLSCRYVRTLFEDSEETLSAYIKRRRLEESARQLRDSLTRTDTVSDIAFRWGFNSLGSYDRAFRARYGTTPRHYRERVPA